MKPIIYATLICGAMMCVSCGRGNASLATYPKQTITYDLPDPEESKWTQFFDSIHAPKIVPLMLDEGEVVSQIEALQMAGGRLYFKDKQLHAVFCCDESGKKIFAIKRRGRGHGEYYDLTDFCVKGDTLYVLDRLKCQILCYSASSGEYLNSITINDRADYYALRVAEERVWLLRQVSNDTERKIATPLVAVDFEGNILSECLPQGEKYVESLSSYYMGGELCYAGERIIARLPQHNTLYAIEADSAWAQYRFDFGDKNIDQFIEESPSGDDEIYSRVLASRGITSLSAGVIDTESDLIMQIIRGEKLMMLMIDKRDGSYRLYSRFMGGLYFLMGADSQLYHLGGEKFATVVSPHMFLLAPFPTRELMEKEGASANLMSVYEQLATMDIKEDDNPLLMVFSLRENE